MSKPPQRGQRAQREGGGSGQNEWRNRKSQPSQASSGGGGSGYNKWSNSRSQPSQASRGQFRKQQSVVITNHSSYARALPGISLKRVEDLLLQDPNDIIMNLRNPRFNFDAYLNADRLGEELIIKLTVLLQRAFESNSFGQQLVALADSVANSKFLTRHVYKLLENRDSGFIRSVLSLCSTLIRTDPHTVEPISLIKDRLELITQHRMNDQSLAEEFNNFIVLLNETTERNEQNNKTFVNVDNSDEQEPPNDFTSMSVVPSLRDIVSNQEIFLRKNVTNGAYNNVRHYLDVQFRLLREDFMQPLRQGVRELRQIVYEESRRNADFRKAGELSREAANKIKRIESLNVYFDVQMNQSIATHLGLVYAMRLSMDKKKSINWETSKRLIYGSLVCLSSDYFEKSCLVGIICERDDKKLKESGEIYLLFNESQTFDIQNQCPVINTKYIMLETSAFFEAYKHVLEALVSFGRHAEGDFPFKENLVDCINTNMPIPRYLTNKPVEFKSILKTKNSVGKCLIGNYDSWPTAQDLGLDESQYAAIRLALTKKLALIQGPPGTGKTFIGVKLVQFLIDNQHAWWNEVSMVPNMPRVRRQQPAVKHRPILMICYTNHALDQFLEYCISECKLTAGVVRVGGRCKSESMNNFLLSKIKEKMRGERRIELSIHNSIKDQRRSIDDAQSKINYLGRCIENVNNGQALLNYNTLSKYMDPACLEQIVEGESMLTNNINDAGLRNNIRMLEWLGILDIDPDELIDLNNNMLRNESGDNQTVEETAQDDDEDDDGVADAISKERHLEDHSNLMNEIMRMRENTQAELNKNKVNLESGEFLDIQAVNDLKNRLTSWQTVGKKGRAKNQSNLIIKKINLSLSHARRLAEQGSELSQMSCWNVWRLDPEARYMLYAQCLEKFTKEKEQELVYLIKEFKNSVRVLKELRQQEDASILKNALIIAMTTTGASRYHAVIKDIKPRIVIVEEAAEVFEAHIVSALSKETEHLILIGDHVQLRPNPTVYRLAKDYHLDVSLFERLINNDTEKVMLSCQHRMRPEISVLMRHFYDHPISDHESVNRFPKVIGLEKSIFFLTHANLENKLEDATTKINQFEVDYLVKLSEYLVKQKYKPSQITILSMYLGQMSETRKKLKRFPNLNGIKVTTVDNYQGEENDFILLSLVRSNKDGRIGFLEVVNRCCVALSRARMGLFCIGNFEFLCSSKRGQKWLDIVNSLKATNNYGRSLTLTCGTHKENDIEASAPSDFDKRVDGGCHLPCNARLDCGHSCPLKCHTYDHKDFKCLKKCEKIMSCSHPCNQQCSHDGPCNKCRVQVEKVVPECGHIITINCDTKPNKNMCYSPCQTILECGHQCTRACRDKCGPCLTQLAVQSPCVKHSGTMSVYCYQKPWTYGENCQQPCKQVLECGHTCIGTCQQCHNGRIHMLCEKQCKRILFCGHECQLACSNQCGACTHKCKNKCVHSDCKRMCYEPCAQCIERCKNKCPHSECSKLCWEPCDKQPCNEPCDKKIKCGHECIGLCGEPCPPLCRICHENQVTDVFFGTEDEPTARFVYLRDCRHIIEVSGMDEWIKSRFESQAANTGNTIKLPECPRCKTPIMSCLRYSKYIKQQLNDIEKIKLQQIGDQRRNQQIHAGILKEAFEHPEFQSKGYAYSFHAQLVGMSSLTHNLAIMLTNTWTIYKRVYDIQESISKHFESFPEQKYHLTYETSNIMYYLYDESKKEVFYLSDQQLREISAEVERVEALVQYYRFRNLACSGSIPVQSPIRVGENLRQIETLIIKSVPCFEQSVKTQVEKRLEELRKDLDTSITPAEKLMIVQAIGLKKGHWFKCQNGHIYCIGECGGAMETSTCPECKAPIGGTNHTLLTDNRLASDMDGAAHAAWSNLANDMANFNLNAI